MTGPALPADERPIDDTPVHTADLPPTPIRDRNIPATAWVEAPDELLALRPVATYKRRIGRWLLWRAGPASKADAWYLAVDAEDLADQHTFRLYPDGSGEGTGPSGQRHERFRTWKEDLRDA
jgi:hypothetical protein